MSPPSTVRHDFRSDTVTRPSPAMRAAMANAEVGDDVYGEDPTVAALECEVAARLGKEAGLFVTSGTQSNLVAILTHCGRGEEYICGQDAHAYRYEAGGAAVLGGVQPQPVTNAEDGTLPLDLVARVIKPDDPHFAMTRLVTVENTIGGKPLPGGYAQALSQLARARGLSLHLDGARLFNAALADGVGVGDLAAPFDSVSLCLSKGLGAPAGSVLAGDAAFIARARRWRKMLGGSMRQSGILAAAGLHALRHNVERLAEDHANAALLADAFSGLEGIETSPAQTNMVFLTLTSERAKALPNHLAAMGLAATVMDGGARLRWVTHMDVGRDSVRHAGRAVRRFVETGVVSAD